MTPRTPGRRTASRALVALGSVALALGATACSAAGDPSAAAVVEGRVISEADVQTVASELPLELTGGQPVAGGDVLSVMVVADIVEDVAREYTGVAGSEQARQQLEAIDLAADREPVDYSQPTVDLIATLIMQQNISQTDVAQPELQARAEELQASGDIQINPRYGQVVDGAIQFNTFTHDWLAEPSAGAQPSEPVVSED